MAVIDTYNPRPHRLAMRGAEPIALNGLHPTLAHAPAIVNQAGSGHPELGAPGLDPPHIAQAPRRPYRKIALGQVPAREYPHPVAGGVGPKRNIQLITGA